jgi:hypothetical protein
MHLNSELLLVCREVLLLCRRTDRIKEIDNSRRSSESLCRNRAPRINDTDRLRDVTQRSIRKSVPDATSSLGTAVVVCTHALQEM